MNAFHHKMVNLYEAAWMHIVCMKCLMSRVFRFPLQSTHIDWMFSFCLPLSRVKWDIEDQCLAKMLIHLLYYYIREPLIRAEEAWTLVPWRTLAPVTVERPPGMTYTICQNYREKREGLHREIKRRSCRGDTHASQFHIRWSQLTWRVVDVFVGSLLPPAGHHWRDNSHAPQRATGG